jgi:hypothetical protein
MWKRFKLAWLCWWTAIRGGHLIVNVTFLVKPIEGRRAAMIDAKDCGPMLVAGCTFLGTKEDEDGVGRIVIRGVSRT